MPMYTNQSQENKEENASDTLQQWFEKPPSSFLFELESSAVSKILSKLFGYHILQLGNYGTSGFLSGSSIAHKMIMRTALLDSDSTEYSLIGDEQSLALASDSIDVVVLPHVLEFAENPHKLLREVERVLIGEGHLVLTCFNPWSWWGLWRLVLFWREEPPWNGHFYSYPRIKDWLSLLDLELVEYHRLFYRPPLQNLSMMKKLIFWEKLGKLCWPFFCGAYVILAKKRVVPLTPIKTRWHARRQLIASGVLESGTSG